MILQECIDLLGKPINDPFVIAFIDKYGYKYPKKDTISNLKNITERSYWIEHKKAKINFNCNGDIKNTKYKALPAQRKGTYYPLISEFRIYNNNTITELPWGLNFEMSYDEIVAIMGQPDTKSSDLAKVWLNDDGSESWYRWKKNIDATGELLFGVDFWTNKKSPRDMSIRLREDDVLIHLYDEMKYENFDSFLKRIDNHSTAYLLFIRWALEKGLMRINEVNKNVLSGNASEPEFVLAYLKTLGRGYVATEDFIQEQSAIRRYINNLNGDDVYFYGDFIKTFLTDQKLLNNTFGEDAQAALNKVSFTDENYQEIKKVLERNAISTNKLK